MKFAVGSLGRLPVHLGGVSARGCSTVLAGMGRLTVTVGGNSGLGGTVRRDGLWGMWG